MKSLSQKIKQCAGLIGTSDVNQWQSDFLQNIVDRTNEGEDTRGLSPAQVETLESIYDRHFA